MIKPAELIDVIEISPLTLTDRRIYNTLIANAWDTIDQPVSHSIAKRDLRGTRDANDRVGESIERLMASIARLLGKAPAALLIDLVSQSIEKRPRQAARPEGSLVAPLLRLHEGEEAAEIAALHRPRALRGGHLDGKVRFQPGDEGVAAVCDIEAHRQADLSCFGSGLSAISGPDFLSFSDLARFGGGVRHRSWHTCIKTLDERYLLCSEMVKNNSSSSRIVQFLIRLITSLCCGLSRAVIAMVGVCRTPRPKLQNKSKQRTVLANKLEGHIEAGHAFKERREISFLRKFNADEGRTCFAIVLFYVLE